MKKSFSYIICPFVVLILITPFIPKPAHTGMMLADFPQTASHDSRYNADTVSRQWEPMIQEELTYYLDRHNVQDEGYEMVVAFAGGRRHQVNIDGPLPVWNVGTWNGHGREGIAVDTDSAGRTVIGICHADTLEAGYRPDSAGTYIGSFAQGEAHGHGAFLQADGGYFEGRWENGLRHGFGLQVIPGDTPRLRVGEWQNDRFKGERMRYTTERIYGIDIARYQHGTGRKKYPIRWDRLRITHVGRKASRNVSGVADYPISFIYIKSTEGTSVRNRFYADDYRQARKRGIPAGAYHFFSTQSSGAAQAHFFIRNTRFSQGDLPPVLDVEPSDAQIQRMGGAERLFAHVRAWLTAVHHRTGVRPILYISQMFVNKYLPLAPDLKRDYRVWIARYGEYKPDIRLTYWQLCPDGRVAGIRGDVDINVFNGYRNQFEDFLKHETINHQH